MELTKKDTKMLQGLAVLAMVCLHLFCRNDYEGLYHPYLFIKGIPLSFYFAQLSDFCVMCFAFCSGYAHFVQYSQNDGVGYYKRRLKSLLLLLINYWIIILLYCIACLIKDPSYIGGIRGLLGNVLLYSVSYNGAWWYMWAYVLLVIISPLLLKLVKNFNWIFVIVIGLIIYTLAYYVRFKVTTDNYFLLRFGPFGMTLFEYLIGCVFCKTKCFSKMSKLWNIIPKAVRIIGSVAIFIGMLIVRTLFVQSLLVAPITGIVIIVLFHFWKKPKAVEKAFLFIGEHSTNIWLTHMFFYHTLFINLVYIAYEPLFIYVFMISITVALSYVIRLLLLPFAKLLNKNKALNV